MELSRQALKNIGFEPFTIQTSDYDKQLTLPHNAFPNSVWHYQVTEQSLLFNVTGPFVFNAVYLQPYVGAGANVLWHRNQEFLLDEKFTITAAGSGGLDIGFMAVPNLTVSADVTYFSKSFYGYDTESDIGLTFGVDWYFK